jgi:glucose-6-phosphate isomerase
LANVDPIDFGRATEELNPESTIIVINSKTFTTAETILNAKTAKKWLLDGFRKQGIKLDTAEEENKVCNIHVSAVSTNLKATGEFGISPSQVFGFWDWVGGRYSVWSAIGILPLSL